MPDSGLLAVSFDKNKTIILEKTQSTSEDKKINIQKALELTPASKEQLCKKWYFQGREMPGANPEIVKTTDEMFKGSWFIFKPDSTYEVKMGKIEDGGRWTFRNNNQTILLTANGERKFWQIKTITETHLVLIKGNSEEIWNFSTRE
jgi:hypothetical protein